MMVPCHLSQRGQIGLGVTIPGLTGLHVDTSRSSPQIPFLYPPLSDLTDAPSCFDSTISRRCMTPVGLGDDPEAYPGRRLSPVRHLPPEDRSLYIGTSRRPTSGFRPVSFYGYGGDGGRCVRLSDGWTLQTSIGSWLCGRMAKESLPSPLSPGT